MSNPGATPRRATLFSIAPHAPFLATLADRILDGTLLDGWDRNGPFWLADVTIILPTRRSRLALAEAFRVRGHALLPDIRTFGGEAAEEEPFLPPFDAPVPPPRATELERRLVLSRLVAGWAETPTGRDAFATPPSASEILAMAESLGRLIDDLTTEERSAADVHGIGAAMEERLGAYWQQTLQFLDIALSYWPSHLAAVGRADAASLRTLRLDRQAMTAPLLYGERPVIAAGSTGSIPATARLLQAIARLPRGAIVLPGFDTSLTGPELAALLDDSKNAHGHPQFGLARLLKRLGAAGADVVDLDLTANPRTTLIRRALAPTEATALWAGQRLTATELDTAGTGLSIIAARTEDEEARAIALVARAALVEGKTVGIVTPDGNLARRIAAELGRFAVKVDDPAGTPLFQSAAGRLARQIIALATNHCSAVDLIALLRNRATLLGLPRIEISSLADRIELGLLRGQRPDPGIAGLRLLLTANFDGTTKYPALRLTPKDCEDITALFNRLEAALAPLFALGRKRRVTAAAFAEALCAAFTGIAGDAEMPGRREFDDWAREVAAQADEGHRFSPRQLDAVLQALMLGYQVRTHEVRRTDIAILGQLEARLQNPDLLVLAGVNEDIWPAPADPGPWLSRGMRIAAGLEPPERRQGLAAHDFAQGLGNAEVVVAFSERVGSSPAIASRLLQRIEAFAGEDCAAVLRRKGAIWLDAARRIDAVSAVVPASRPVPNPPVDQRPRQLSVTEIETLMRSPYDLYAKHVLGLRQLDPLGESPDARERGTIIHHILARFVSERHDVMAEGAIEVLRDLAIEEFAGLEAIGERRDIWLKRFETAARQFLEFERERNPRIIKRHAEIDGRWELPHLDGFVLTGRADRVDETVDGLEILDFKTGSPPQPRAMRAFEVPQLLLEAQMAMVGGLDGVPAGPSHRLTYIKIGLGPDAFVPKDFAPADGFALMEAADEIARRMQLHVAHFLLGENPMPARLLPLPGQRFRGAYEHLARTAEWTAVDGEEGEA